MAITRRRLCVVLALVGAVAVALALALFADRLGITEKGRMRRSVDAMRDAARRADVDGLFSYVSAGYRDDRFSRSQLRALAEGFFAATGPVESSIHKIEITRSGRTGAIRLALTVRVPQSLYPGAPTVLVWDLKMRKEADGVWRLTRLTPVRVGPNDVTGWGDVEGRY